MRFLSYFLSPALYGHSVKTRLIALALTLVISTTFGTHANAAVIALERPTSLNPTRVVSFRPNYGYSAERVRVRLSQSEVDIIARMQRIADTWESASPPPTNLLNWRIEPSVAGSPTVSLAIDAFHQARAFLSVPYNSGTVQIAIIIGRNVIVINLTGYLFLRSVTQPITASMEARREPVLSSMSYLIVDRNLSSIAHEWTHVARNRLSDGFVPDNEPAWFREGLAEVISGLSRVKASAGRYRYSHFHIIRLRKFANWPNICGIRLTRFRTNGDFASGCEYLSGGAAVELLLAKYGGIPKVITLYSHLRESGDFLESFKYTYGMSLREFERRADIYAKYISQAANW